MTRKDAERHLDHLARRRARYATRREARTPRQLELFPLTPKVTPPLTEKQRAAIRREVRNLAVGHEWARQIRETVFGERDLSMERLAKIDSREIYSENLYVDSDEWLRIRETEWAENFAASSRIGE
jgi:hypothetical protein